MSPWLIEKTLGDRGCLTVDQEHLDRENIRWPRLLHGQQRTPFLPDYKTTMWDIPRSIIDTAFCNTPYSVSFFNLILIGAHRPSIWTVIDWLSTGQGWSLILIHVAVKEGYRVGEMELIRCLGVVLDVNHLQSTKFLILRHLKPFRPLYRWSGALLQQPRFTAIHMIVFTLAYGILTQSCFTVLKGLIWD